jgi:serine/alanine adding enzyme
MSYTDEKRPLRGREKRHCMVVHAYYPLGETRVQRQAEALMRRGYQVDVISLRKPGEASRETFKGTRIYRLPVRRYRRGGLAAQFVEYMAFLLMAMVLVSWRHLVRPYATIQLHSPPDFLVFAAWLPKLLGARLILDLHDLMPEFYMGRFGRGAGSLPVRLVRLQERISCRFADHVITVSHHWRQNLMDRGVPGDKVSVVMNVADDAIFVRPDQGAETPVPSLPLHQGADNPNPEEDLHLIYHGVVVERYGLDLVLRAMDRLRDEAPGIQLTILGRGDHMDSLRHLTEELELDGRVTLYDELRPAEELPGIILQADAGIVPYRDDPFTDGLLPTKLMEYGALGLPSIAARTTAIARYFEGTMAELFAPGSVDDLTRVLKEIYRDRSRLAALAARADGFNRDYNWTKIGAEYVNLVRRLGSGEASPGTLTSVDEGGRRTSVKIVRTLDEANWSRFVQEHPGGTIFHTPEMFQVYERAAGHRPVLWAAVEAQHNGDLGPGEERILALLLPVEITVSVGPESLSAGPLRRLATRAVVFGSVLCAPGPEGEAALDRLLEAYRQETDGRLLFTELRNVTPIDGLQPVLDKHGFAYEEHLNYLIDLERPLEEVMQAISKRARKQIRRGLRKGEVVVEEVRDREGLAECYELLRHTFAAAQVPLADISLFEAAFDLLQPRGMIRYFVARVEGKAAACSVDLLYKDRSYGWYGGTDREFSSQYPTEILTWHVFEWSAQHGYRLYDFGGAGKPDEEYGVRDFKAKFGGELVSYGRNTCVHAPVLLKASKAGYSVLRRLGLLGKGAARNGAPASNDGGAAAMGTGAARGKANGAPGRSEHAPAEEE